MNKTSQRIDKVIPSYFITATDTDAGKTYVAQIITKALVEKHKRVAVYKPVSAGCEFIDNQWLNSDALALTKIANCEQTISQVNPIAFEAPIAPHIAAKKIGQRIELSQIEKAYDDLLSLTPDIIITEGAGGWRLPLGNNVFLSDFVKAKQIAVILVVNMKLGCLNHARLTYEAIIADGLTCTGWVANCPTEMPYLDENIKELKTLLPVPCIAELACQPNINHVASKIDVSFLV